MTNNNTRTRRTSVPKSKRKKQRSIGGSNGVSRTPDTHSVASSSSSTWSSDQAKQRTAVKNELNDIIDNDQDGFWTRPSNAEERQRIREFWLQLREDERRSLIKIEKEAVLKKMKEQQRHSCNCSVCGKKRYVFSSLPLALPLAHYHTHIYAHIHIHITLPPHSTFPFTYPTWQLSFSLFMWNTQVVLHVCLCVYILLISMDTQVLIEIPV